jgi:hypothetical protein
MTTMIRKQDYFKSPEGVKEFEKLNLTYEDEMWDDAYDAFLKLTKRTPAKEVEREIHNMLRVVLPNGKQYIIHDMTETRKDPIGNIKKFYRNGLGEQLCESSH